MGLSFFLAQLFGLTLMLFAVIAIIRPVIITVAMRDLRPYSFVMLLAGFIGIFGGIALLLAHPIWEFSWRGLVTLMGLAAVIKGVTYVAFPETLKITGAGFFEGTQRRNTVLVVAFLFGAYLTYKGLGF